MKKNLIIIKSIIVWKWNHLFTKNYFWKKKINYCYGFIPGDFQVICCSKVGKNQLKPLLLVLAPLGGHANNSRSIFSICKNTVFISIALLWYFFWTRMDKSTHFSFWTSWNLFKSHILKATKFLQLLTKFQTAMVSCFRFIQIKYSSDHRRVWIVNFLLSKLC